ncbi:hypothetical protein STRTUCAR8_06339 [Streptomyces turgidiscabies Car8]|uniref:Uncharacterized protein n=1 Tax=Streptomyces turgidiscabies (strain Car8) TaxID=698760 RepID=L7EWG5_STRT8|nr:hypothetical protein STRTUCAR8_06339 [Streptomyces turgidiscabies Car8]
MARGSDRREAQLPLLVGYSATFNDSIQSSLGRRCSCAVGISEIVGQDP